MPRHLLGALAHPNFTCGMRQSVHVAHNGHMLAMHLLHLLFKPVRSVERQHTLCMHFQDFVRTDDVVAGVGCLLSGTDSQYQLVAANLQPLAM
jgi:hypothetical protein